MKYRIDKTIFRDIPLPTVNIGSEKVRVYRIQALEDFGDVQEGDYGGFVEYYENLVCKDGDSSWIYDNGVVFGASVLRKDSLLHCGEVCGDSVIENSIININGRVIESKITDSWIDSFNYMGSNIRNSTITNISLDVNKLNIEKSNLNDLKITAVRDLYVRNALIGNCTFSSNAKDVSVEFSENSIGSFIDCTFSTSFNIYSLSPFSAQRTFFTGTINCNLSTGYVPVRLQNCDFFGNLHIKGDTSIVDAVFLSNLHIVDSVNIYGYFQSNIKEDLRLNNFTSSGDVVIDELPTYILKDIKLKEGYFDGTNMYFDAVDGTLRINEEHVFDETSKFIISYSSQDELSELQRICSKMGYIKDVDIINDPKAFKLYLKTGGVSLMGNVDRHMQYELFMHYMKLINNE